MKRIFVTGISQESNSFNPLKSIYEDFMIIRDEELRARPGVKELIAAGFEVTASIYARAVPGGTLKFEDFTRLVEEMLAPLMAGGTFDGVFLPMHGALDVEFIGSAETFIVTRVREMVGPDVPISVPLDMHANNTFTMIDQCNVIYGFRTAPHIDVEETHIRAAELLIRSLNENVLPHTEVIRIPYAMPGENMMPEYGIGKEVIAFLAEIEAQEDVWCASYFVGMTWVDCPQNGAAVIISGAGSLDRGMEKARELARFVWKNRDQFKYPGIAAEPEDAVAFVKEHRSDGPVIVSDSADNVTAGAAGDNACMLNLFLRHGIRHTLFAAITDPAAVEKCLQHNIGDIIDLKVGASIDARSESCFLAGAELKTITGGPENQSAVLSFQGIDVLLFKLRKPVPTEEVLNSHGLSLHDYQVIVVKQGYLTPELEDAAKHQVLALTPGNCDQRVERLQFKTIRRPMYPLDKAEDIEKTWLNTL